ncbi:Transcription elongation factor B polypeptide 2 [Stylophora pistillata]|uniref:Elongin-B n=2 Tax=Stylophora pistillata TaxID=50429 RepID=A0A2B4SJ96_STYPI|nr:Transcription elongation factor B polypeptide 2 [Stylophora pistillata]
MVRREKTTIFLDCKEATTVYELKKMVEGITKKAPEDQRLYKDDQILDDAKTLEDCGITTQTAKAQSPALISLSFKGEDGEFEPVVIAPLSTPPELPDVMKPQETVSNSDGS